MFRSRRRRVDIVQGGSKRRLRAAAEPHAWALLAKRGDREGLPAATQNAVPYGDA